MHTNIFIELKKKWEEIVSIYSTFRKSTCLMSNTQSLLFCRHVFFDIIFLTFLVQKWQKSSCLPHSYTHFRKHVDKTKKLWCLEFEISFLETNKMQLVSFSQGSTSRSSSSSSSSSRSRGRRRSPRGHRRRKSSHSRSRSRSPPPKYSSSRRRWWASIQRAKDLQLQRHLNA